MALYKKTKARFPRVVPMVASVLAALSLETAPDLYAATVTSCADDGGADTLRYAALTVADNGTIDLTQLTCSKITLISGAVNIGADYVTVVGPGENALTIDGNQNGRVFDQSAAHLTTIADMTITGGVISDPLPLGGCVYSKSSVQFIHATVTGCAATGTQSAAGGGVFATKGAYLLGSTVSNNTSTSTGTSGKIFSYAGGVFAGEYLVLDHSTLSGNTTKTLTGTSAGGGAVVVGKLHSKYSTITENKAIGSGATNNYGEGGGLIGLSLSYAIIDSSTIDHNQADEVGGVAIVSGTAQATLSNSTISSNVANATIGGASFNIPVTISNSTVAFNNGGSLGGGGLYLNSMSAVINSSIIADNAPAGMVAGKAVGADIGGSAPITGAFNLIQHSSIAVPADTLTTDPRLSPLGCHGGPTRTHALLTGSPAIDAGFADAAINYDQRGSGFVRSAGTSADIGAYESDPDQVFGDSFDCE
jgi:hypothetical protein